MLKTNTPAARRLDQILPHFTISVLPYDPLTFEAAFLWRGNNVRSAQNCLSIPSGLLEHGESFTFGLVRELQEELDLDVEESDFRFHTLYSNQPDDGFHWVIGTWSIPVCDLRKLAVNAEPHKHDFLTFIDLAFAKRLAQQTEIFAPNLAPSIVQIVDCLLS